MRNSDWPFAVTSQLAAPAVNAAVTAVKYAGAAFGIYLLYSLVTKGVAGTAAGITRGVVGGAVDAGAGVVVGAGEVVGIPATDQERCREAIYAGRTWDASFACPAGTFLRYVVGGTPPPPSGGLSGLRRPQSRRFLMRKSRQACANRNC